MEPAGTFRLLRLQKRLAALAEPKAKRKKKESALKIVKTLGLDRTLPKLIESKDEKDK